MKGASRVVWIKENGLKLMSQRYIFAATSEKHQSSSPMRTPSIITSRAAFMLSTTDIKNKKKKC